MIFIEINSFSHMLQNFYIDKLKKNELEPSSYVFLAWGAPFYGCMLRYKL